MDLDQCWDVGGSSGQIGADHPPEEGRDCLQAVPSLLWGVVGTNLPARAAHIPALVQIHADPALVVPVLAKCLGDGDPLIQLAAADALGEFGADAKSTVPPHRQQ